MENVVKKIDETKTGKFGYAEAIDGGMPAPAGIPDPDTGMPVIPGVPVPGAPVDPMQPFTPTPFPGVPIEEPGRKEQISRSAALFGQTEEEIGKEFREYKAAKLFRRFDCDMTNEDGEESFSRKSEDVKRFGFGSVVVNPLWVARAKTEFASSDVKVMAAIAFPFGEELGGVKLYAVKKSLKLGADGVFVCVGRTAVKRGRYDFIGKEFKKIVKAAKKKRVCAVFECESLTDSETDKTVKTLVRAGVKEFLTASGVYGAGFALSNAKKLRAAAGVGANVSCYTAAKHGDEIVSLLSSADRVFLKCAAEAAKDLRENLG